MRSSAWFLLGMCLVVAVLSIFSGCAMNPHTGGESPGFSIERLEIPSVVSTNFPYKAKMYCRGLESVDILAGHFFWDREGPFEYRVTEIDLQKGEITFDLRTKNPGTYFIRGYVSFRDKATGKSRMSNVVSAGSVAAR